MNARAEELAPEQLTKVYDLREIGLKSTEEAPSAAGIVGQERAITALEFGLTIQDEGYNIYVAGPPGIGKMTAVESFLKEMAQRKPVPPDWCYVNNFSNTYQPCAMQLPPGRGRELRDDLQALVQHVQQEIPKLFESEEYQARMEELNRSLNQQREAILQDLNRKAADAGFAIQSTPFGMAIVPLRESRPMSEEELNALAPSERRALQKKSAMLQRELKATLKQARQLEKESKSRLQAMDQQIVLYLVGGLVDDLQEKYHDLPEVVTFLERVQQDVLENIDDFKARPESAERPPGQPDEHTLKRLKFRKYEVNVFVDNSGATGAPVVLELNPTYQNLFGRIEKESVYGVLSTDFTMIKPGSLHAANGGYLVLPAEDLLKNLYGWDGLKRALRNGEIQIEELGERLGFAAIKGLRPQPIPLNLKVILVGRPLIYYMLHSMDEDYQELFKVRADFDTKMDSTSQNVIDFVGFLATLCEKESLLHLNQGAIQALLQFASRLAADQEKLSTHFGAIADIVREANYWAVQAGAKEIGDEHVQKAKEQKIYRSSMIQDQLKEMIARRTLLVDVTGSAVGQVNGLSVITLGDYMFGKPSRITASVGPGRGGIVDIEREVQMGGPIHSKGVLILGGYLANRFAREKPLSLSARLVFEQSYEGVDGDSASSTELYAILSALAEVPVKQGIAVTGSVNQHGLVQAIGGVNQKIEAFFDVCKNLGLNGEQGVLIPQSNVKHLMLRQDVIEAVSRGDFHVWAVSTIDEGIELLTGLPAGALKDDGTFPEGSINARVQQRLSEYAAYYERSREEGMNGPSD